ncbi:hypothetical protein MJO29_001677, partial [Puccinia striiformis f. sp. tritici]
MCVGNGPNPNDFQSFEGRFGCIEGAQVPSRLQNDPIGGRSQVALEAAAGRLRGAWRPASKSTSRQKREAASRLSSIQWVRD